MKKIIIALLILLGLVGVYYSVNAKTVEVLNDFIPLAKLDTYRYVYKVIDGKTICYIYSDYAHGGGISCLK